MQISARRPASAIQIGICQVYRIRKSRDEHDAIMQATEGDGDASRTRGGKPLVRW
ncbi:hypothetical protein QA640_35855 [Bradyrhizobium sp. CB82]|uniref:hypothetical protein n=1 Tax=Bradyrhizobium sp. CB82 TaxID=3039159 RepID=UPI0024B11B45|nr:hypothetical protein [Bradyrhizobium sp. CB82]WFU39679.1 hypothetical protein QA640_35855 [Bradyrhizobium sp. CB82]